MIKDVLKQATYQPPVVLEPSTSEDESDSEPPTPKRLHLEEDEQVATTAIPVEVS